MREHTGGSGKKLKVAGCGEEGEEKTKMEKDIHRVKQRQVSI